MQLYRAPQQARGPAGRAALPARPRLAVGSRPVNGRGTRLVSHTASVEAPAAAPAAPARPQPAEQAAPAAASPSKPYSWTQQWWPVIPVEYLDQQKPYAATLLGQQYVVWWQPGEQRWRVMADRCPHRLAPLSEGRVDADGTLMCSYHGWQFNGSGACTRIPQIGDAAKMAAACASPRACVASFPTAIADGMLFAWLESGPQAEAEAAASPPYVMPELAGTDSAWHMTEVQSDYTAWLEQGMDPTHANWLHHTLGFKMADALPMPAEPLLPSATQDLAAGYLWRHGNYTTKHAGMQAEREFVPPNQLRVVYDRGFVRGFATMGTPVRPGVSRVFGRFAFGPPRKAGAKDSRPLPMRLLGSLPHWVRPSSLADQDTVVNAKQEAYMRSLGLTARDYAAYAPADQGVLAAHRWFDAAGYEQMWADRLGSAAQEQLAAAAAAGAGQHSEARSSSQGVGGRYASLPYSPPASEDVLFNWWERHTKHCKTCQQGMVLLQRAADAASVAALLLVVAAASACVAAKSLASPGALVAALLAGACVWARARLLEFRHTTFINSKYRWQKEGGLSLVQGDPIKLF